MALGWPFLQTNELPLPQENFREEVGAGGKAASTAFSLLRSPSHLDLVYSLVFSIADPKVGSLAVG